MTSIMKPTLMNNNKISLREVQNKGDPMFKISNGKFTVGAQERLHVDKRDIFAQQTVYWETEVL